MKNVIETDSQLSYSSFSIEKGLTEEHKSFFTKNGFIHFKSFFTKERIDIYINELNKIQNKWITEGRKSVNGVPIIYGTDVNNEPIVQRFAFANQFSADFADLLKDERLALFYDLVPSHDCRISSKEKDGLVVNHYINSKLSKWTQMGWHTDALRDIFYGHRIKPMLNVGIHLDDATSHNGGLRVLPGTHNKGYATLLFKKVYFLSTKPDKNEVAIKVKAGDLTIHDGRIWHRVALPSAIGEKSRRRVMYIPIITGKVMEKNKNSKPPLYHYLTRKFS